MPVFMGMTNKRKYWIPVFTGMKNKKNGYQIKWNDKQKENWIPVCIGMKNKRKNWIPVYTGMTKSTTSESRRNLYYR